MVITAPIKTDIIATIPTDLSPNASTSLTNNFTNTECFSGLSNTFLINKKYRPKWKKTFIKLILLKLLLN